MSVELLRITSPAVKAEEYAVVCADVEVMRLDEKFDAIVAEDLIEHLNNFGRVIECVKASEFRRSIFVSLLPIRLIHCVLLVSCFEGNVQTQSTLLVYGEGDAAIF